MLAIVFIVMNAMSLDLHRITLGALIIALGLLVDDAIIAVEMMAVKMEQGLDRLSAASTKLTQGLAVAARSGAETIGITLQLYDQGKMVSSAKSCCAACSGSSR